MTKFVILFSAFFLPLVALAQPAKKNTSAPSQYTDAEVDMLVFKHKQNLVDNLDTLNITGFGQTSYVSSNVVDGTVKSYVHSLQIVVALTTTGIKGTSCQLIFYGPQDNIQQSATSANGVICIYYPVSIYESVRSRLEQAFLARKKVQVMVTQKTDGYREGVLIF